MKKGNIDAINIVFIIIALCFTFLFVSSILIGIKNYNGQKECEKIKTGNCEYYKCLENYTSNYIASNNLLLKYQNCLLENGVNKNEKEN